MPFMDEWESHMALRNAAAYVLVFVLGQGIALSAFALGPEVTYRDDFVVAQTLGEMRANTIRAVDTLLALRQGSPRRSEVVPQDITQLNRTFGYFEAAADAYEERRGRTRMSRCEMVGTGEVSGRLGVVIGAMMRATGRDPYANAGSKHQAAFNAVAQFCGD